MYQVVTVEDEVSVDPTKLSMETEKAIKESLEEKFEGKFSNDIGIVLAITKIEKVDEGRVLPGKPDVHYPVVFKALAWIPKDKEIVEGIVVDITEFGIFVRCGALDGLVHVSQVMDDYVSYDEKNSQFVGKQSRKVLKEGDLVRARIISISLKEQSKLGLTMRQPFLGALKWLESAEEEKQKGKKKLQKPEKKKKKKKRRR